VRVSATRGDGLDALRAALVAHLGGENGTRGDLGGASGNPRHVLALERARAALVRAAEVAAGPGEIVAIELREALAAIGEVTGEGVGEDLLDRIFGRFCVGK
jgi:tRNA modification GTPase